ncbi:hypothetical protein DFH09DRAFT_1080153 [Mycena vulgaris]|nr:hypothetical protein DFH09DRAFT_1080153 [Mycena vulgaris]
MEDDADLLAHAPPVPLLPESSPQPMDVDLEDDEPLAMGNTFIGPLLPGSYFRNFAACQRLRKCPYFPFRTKADFEVTEIAVKGLLSNYLIDNMFRGASSSWNCGGSSHVTLRNHREMQEVLASARKYGVQFKSDAISASYEGKTYHISFEYRDPWDWNQTSRGRHTRPSHDLQLRTEQETYCERIIDEHNTANTWDKYESELPEADPFPQCLLPLHLWLDEGLVTKRVTTHPMVLRPVFLSS